jgi:hypothetical protein
MARQENISPRKAKSLAHLLDRNRLMIIKPRRLEPGLQFLKRAAKQISVNCHLDVSLEIEIPTAAAHRKSNEDVFTL